MTATPSCVVAVGGLCVTIAPLDAAISPAVTDHHGKGKGHR